MNIQVLVEDQKLVLENIYDFNDLKKRISILFDRSVEELSYLDTEADTITICTDHDFEAIDDLEQIVIQAQNLKQKSKIDKASFTKYYQTKYTKEIFLKRLNKYKAALQTILEQEQQLKTIKLKVTKTLPEEIQQCVNMITSFKKISNRQFRRPFLDHLNKSNFWNFTKEIEAMKDFEIMQPHTDFSYQKQLQYEINRRMKQVDGQFQSIYQKRLSLFQTNFTQIQQVKQRKVQLSNELHDQRILLEKQQKMINEKRVHLNHKIQVTKAMLKKPI